MTRPLDELMEAFNNKIEREWPRQLPGHPALYIRGFVLIARNHFRTVRYFCADKPPDPLRRVEYSKCAGPLARVVLELLYTTIYILDSPVDRTMLFEKASYKAIFDHWRRHEKKYGNDPAWADHLAKLRRNLDIFGPLFHLTPQEVADPGKKLRKWPTPKPMRDELAKQRPELAKLFDYLSDWFYARLSEDAHVSGAGFMRQFSGLIAIPGGRDITEDLQMARSRMISAIAALVTALLSEIEMVARFGYSHKLRFVWGLLNETSSLSRGLFEYRYEASL